jgi:formylglycine-generating enzyme required for sulfatase activity
MEASKALAVAPGETRALEVKARWVEGNPRLCFAFDVHSKEDDAKINWTRVIGTVEVPQDGKWHALRTAVTVPQFDAGREWLRPILGFDATQDPTPGRMEVSQIALGAQDVERKALFEESVSQKPQPLAFALYDRPDQAWLAHTFSCHFTFMYDRSFYNPETGCYEIESFLKDGEREFGGHDAVLLWHAYPRIGLDDRNQFDFYRDMPGGLEGLRKVVRRFHTRGVKVFINYNPWDKATHREEVTDEVALAEMVAALEADGIFLDTMFASSPGLRAEVDARRQGVVFVPEAHPKTEDLAELTGSWAQFPANPFSPALLHHKWLEPRHMEYQIRRWNTLRSGTDHAEEIENAFFNVSGMMIWENIFGTFNPWRAEDRAAWRRAVRILKAFPNHVTRGEWAPFYPTAAPGLYANRWRNGDSGLFTLVNKGKSLVNVPLFGVPWTQELRSYDLWSGKPCEIIRRDDRAMIIGSLDWLGCILLVRGDDPPQLGSLLARQSREAQSEPSAKDPRAVADSVIAPEPVKRTPPWTGTEAPQGMVYVPGARLTMHIEHVRRECGCYPDPGTPPEKQLHFLQGWDFSKPMQHTVGPLDVGAFYVDEAEVTNAEFKAFLNATGYRPKHARNFLKHWPNGKMPEELAEHPVVYVDVDDARAYARWAGKRLPTEEEWHLAAQGTDGRKWPWGAEYDEKRVNTSGATMPARSLPQGRSPYGCYHMAGNVYELTESLRNDGHTRFLVLRGGSFYDPNRNPETASIWYVDGGPRPCTHHAKQILMWPGLDRCATVGFRCVKDTAGQ